MSEFNDFAIEKAFTKTYKKYKNRHIAIREAMCLKAMYPAILKPIQQKDLFAGRLVYGAVGFSPEPGGFGYYCNKQLLREKLKDENIPSSIKQDIQDILDFWNKEKTSREKVMAAFPEEMKKALPYEDYVNDHAVAVPLYRMAGGNLDYEKLLSLGIPGMIESVKIRKEKALLEGEDINLFDGMLIVLEVLIDSCKYYSNIISDSLKEETEENRIIELKEMRSVLDNIAIKKPSSLREAIQLFWLYSLLSGVINYGRMDVYLGDFLAKDLEKGILTEEKALSFVQSIWRLIAARKTVMNGRVIVGGLGRPNEKNADKFALLAIEATRTVLEIEPQLSLRFYKGMKKEVYEKALDCLGEGRTFPILYNDDVNIPAVSKAFDISLEEAVDYVPYGCGEYVINHKSFGTPSGIINLVKALEVTINNGVDPTTGAEQGLKLGEFNSFKTFQELLAAYKMQVEYYVEHLADQEELEYKMIGEMASCLYLSMLYDDCLERGKGIFSGGIRYLGGTLETYGNTNTADSLAAIKELVYAKKLISQDEMLEILKSNFEGYEKERNLMLNIPKYGNDNEQADSTAVHLHEFVCNSVRNQKHRTNIHNYLVVIINNDANTILGRLTGASPDGRKAAAPFANANNPSGGSDKNGITALLNSLVKLNPELHAGAVQNMKFSKDLFNKNRPALKALLEVYFNKGGAQSMITVLSKGDLENAMQEPEKYNHIFVRVGGFSARFVELSKQVQQEILSRTLY